MQRIYLTFAILGILLLTYLMAEHGLGSVLAVLGYCWGWRFIMPNSALPVLIGACWRPVKSGWFKHSCCYLR